MTKTRDFTDCDEYTPYTYLVIGNKANRKHHLDWKTVELHGFIKVF